MSLALLTSAFEKDVQIEDIRTNTLNRIKRMDTKKEMMDTMTIGSYPGFKWAMEYLKSDVKFENLVKSIEIMWWELWNGELIVLFVDFMKEGDEEDLFFAGNKLWFMRSHVNGTFWKVIGDELNHLLTQEYIKKGGVLAP